MFLPAWPQVRKLSSALYGKDQSIGSTKDLDGGVMTAAAMATCMHALPAEKDSNSELTVVATAPTSKQADFEIYKERLASTGCAIRQMGFHVAH